MKETWGWTEPIAHEEDRSLDRHQTLLKYPPGRTLVPAHASGQTP